ncbi:iron-sulfur cluster assembly accessory protein Isa2, putative [Talaromyces stipitatus ATCC 10500]|uniref:Iron-sulfur cluster assembly accessory protein Isa2, putative n=1 Tax=Talaromyces stipitatus (strain ATCC 10500 / CBS 375.48 / QM 6759 / NRRL 1006) TaxID=441959 RepID=B8M8K4_TALSN|nr:iron-sulfur cluster assembly accessory protein Isa2, putative [Talaromyces stipitatus ATCC 10500]EED20517.1 iron-sulfur cluster assembly accessory protein Isa2, putative [Talaromyces stipitatus ATCC 10500]
MLEAGIMYCNNSHISKMLQRLPSITCRAVQRRTSLVAEFIRQDCQRSLSLSSHVSHVQFNSSSTSIRQRRTTPFHSSANTLVASRHSRSLRPFVQNSAAFSTTRTTRAPAIATLNPRDDDDGNPMFIEISPRAAKRLSEITASSEEDQHLRVTVTSGGCHGFQYLMSLEPSTKIDQAEDTVFEPSETDETLPGGKARVVMDQPSLELLSGSTVDFTTELIGSQFKVNNPRATSNCGCGTSFDINL